MRPIGMWGNVTLGIVILLLAIVPLMLNKDAAFEGADGQAENLIASIAPTYQPWVKNVFEPPSGEVESLLFALQAAIGSGVLFFGIGYLVGTRKRPQ